MSPSLVVLPVSCSAQGHRTHDCLSVAIDTICLSVLATCGGRSALSSVARAAQRRVLIISSTRCRAPVVSRTVPMPVVRSGGTSSPSGGGKEEDPAVGVLEQPDIVEFGRCGMAEQRKHGVCVPVDQSPVHDGFEVSGIAELRRYVRHQ